MSNDKLRDLCYELRELSDGIAEGRNGLEYTRNELRKLLDAERCGNHWCVEWFNEVQFFSRCFLRWQDCLRVALGVCPKYAPNMHYSEAMAKRLGYPAERRPKAEERSP